MRALFFLIAIGLSKFAVAEIQTQDPKPEITFAEWKSSGEPYVLEVDPLDSYYPIYEQYYIQGIRAQLEEIRAIQWRLKASVHTASPELQAQLTQRLNTLQLQIGSLPEADRAAAEADHATTKTSSEIVTAASASKVTPASFTNGQKEFENGFLKMAYRLDYAQISLIREEGKLKPYLASSLSAEFKIKKVPGKLFVQFLPGAVFAVHTVRNEVRAEASHLGRSQVSQLTGIPIDQLDKRAATSPQLQGLLAFAQRQATAQAAFINTHDVTIGNALKTGLVGLKYEVNVGDFTFAVGKGFPSVQRDIVPDATSMIWGSNPFTSATHNGKYLITGVVVYADRGFRENTSGYASAFVNSMILAGEAFWKISPDSYEGNLELTRAALDRMGLKFLTVVTGGMGSRASDTVAIANKGFGSNHNLYGYSRIDFKIKRLWGQVLPYVQQQSNGVTAFRLWTHSRLQMVKSSVLGVKSYRANGSAAGSFRNYQAYVEIPLPGLDFWKFKDYQNTLQTAFTLAEGPAVRRSSIHGENHDIGFIMSFILTPKGVRTEDRESLQPAHLK